MTHTNEPIARPFSEKLGEILDDHLYEENFEGAKNAAVQAIIELFDKEVIGADEPVKKVEGLAVFKIKTVRNQLRSGQRAILNEGRK